MVETNQAMHVPDPGATRISGKRHSISYDRTQAFFNARANGAGENHLTATMYQDSTLAARRDEFEKQTVLPLLELHPDDRVLDLGCGVGRWAQVIAPFVAQYLGIDFSEKLLSAARANTPSAVFQCMRVDSLNVSALEIAPPFTLILCSGIFAYINDADLLRLFHNISQIAASGCRIYIREPVAKAERLTLDEYWSDDLKSSYSAIYRTRMEYLRAFDSLLGFSVQLETKPFPGELQNRAETEQHCFLLKRRSRS